MEEGLSENKMEAGKLTTKEAAEVFGQKLIFMDYVVELEQWKL